MDNATILSRAREVMETEIEGLRAAQAALGDDFLATVRLLTETLDRDGKIVVTGVGKNLHIAEKLSATLASTGSTSVVMNPIQAMHGDLGMIAARDVLLALSFSGESEEVIRLIPAVRRLEVPVIAMVGNPESTLARLSDVTLCVRIGREACPFGMAPTTSTTATLAVGDALAMVLIDTRQFDKASYARLHPAGAIGRALVLRVRDIMRTGERLASLRSDASIMDAVMAMTAAQSGAALMTDPEGRLVGIFTDGDLRRLLSEGRAGLHEPLAPVMTRNPKSVADDAFAVDVLRVFERYKIDDLPVVDARGLLVGVVDIQDLPKMKVM
ncbi:MAG TPA: KpsF/GutQ family sugar-phosphate isomerase [Kiritimatiellia bacterium]|nr:KpsF/GutQ family sugar-phosphate isomerase [Kiritimatiellia bacterium]HRU20434.1 KpsF/GutQ family sugar-phosphate isomerase [Kiritimatiellia bacterium]